jgi:hypothetical protein
MLWYFTHLFVIFSMEKFLDEPSEQVRVLSLERTKKNSFSFGSLLTFSYLCALIVRETAHTWPLIQVSWLSLNRSLRRQISIAC